MKKIIKEVIVVEGRDDISAVKAAVDAELIQTNGFAIRKKGNIEKLRKAYENKGLIVLTDPDFVGEELRKFIQKHFPNVKHAYITRKSGTKDGDIGIENASPETIIEALEKAKCEVVNQNENLFDMNTLIENGLVGRDESTNLREKLGGVLGIGYANGKQFLSKLNRYGIKVEDFEKAMKEIRD
ncbi:MAG: ribonuclease M5 [Cetobacterium sp.]|uniref:ribonuclease M5 n=1 Tax=unclassified Cetobacterium TaxID=2630983 RepID=UPI00163C6073|nr:ribonuclease M5 [Cetobacterium sp. 2A]MBC2855677.1 ribonuclease M5 [Cetobacterium sp. 2A]